MALVLPFTFRRPIHPLGNVSLLASQLRAPVSTDGTRLWLPSDLGSKLQMWLKGEDLSGANASPITTWTDATTNANDATGAPAKPSLVTSGLNGMNTAAFDGVGQYMTLPTGLLTGRTQSASFAVYSLAASPPTAGFPGPVLGDFGTDATTGNHDPFSDGNFYEDYCSTTRRTVTGVPASTAFRIFGLRSKSADWRLDVNGTNYYTDGTNTFAANTAPMLGSTRAPAAYYVQGQIAEIVDCNDFLLTSEKEQVEGYLAWKWGLEGSLPIGHTYAATAPRTAIANNSIAGSSTLVFTPSATLLGSGAVSGSSTLTFADSATLLGSGAVSGSSSLVFSPSGTVSGLIAGTATVLLSPSATLIGAGAVSGASTIVFAPSATLLGKGAVSGSSTLTFAPSSTLLGKGVVVGSSTIIFTPSATLFVAGAISGTSSLTFSGSGTLLGAGALLGSTALSLSAAATLLGKGQLQGASSLSFAGSATLPSLSQIVGSTSFSLTLSGHLAFGFSGQVKVHILDAEQAKPVKVWNGSAWIVKPLKFWTGTVWRATGY